MQEKKHFLLFSFIILLESGGKTVLHQKIPYYRDVPTVYACGRDENLEPGATFGPVIRDVYVIECCFSGYGGVVINGKEYAVRPGDAYFLMPGDVVLHTADVEEPRTGVWCFVDGLQVGRALSEAGISTESPFAQPCVFKEIYREVEEIVSLEHDDSIGADFRRTACIYRILAALHKDHKKNDSYSLITKSIGMMETQYDTHLTVDSLAAAVGLERSYFSVLFKKSTGCSPHEYLSKLRVKKACTLIREYDYPISQVAEKVGLDTANFARTFKKMTGKTPREYKNEETEEIDL